MSSASTRWFINIFNSKSNKESPKTANLSQD